ncbi:expressed unknown protein [Seminavis robusta]|uniref:RNA ligase domain-containing protein n=1 Tax=Seminavis robusta TaxID=568900 RepID=A0A9N8EG45_9STRA|nr:expressed unknown protein [Seminavis robusta]|eukprot:Sro895_g217190.1 n/a (422) ;mRNA; f:20510-21775
MTNATNPTQWPKFEHAGIWYADHCEVLLIELSVPVIFLQRWWRQRAKPRKNQKVYTIIRRGRFFTVAGSAERLRFKDPALLRKFRAFEKLDGTNLGVRCDGAVFGRRTRVFKDSYQKVPLDGVVPTAKEVRAVKQVLLGSETANGTELVLYGELMCNPRKFDYDERSMDSKFYCFGAMVRFPDTFSGKDVLAAQRAIKQRGFAPTINGNSSGRVALNDRLRELLVGQGIPCAPLLGEGPFGELCLSMKATLMKDGMEGVVLTGDDGSLKKWKTSVEDESKTHAMLSALIQQHPRYVFELAGVDVDVIQCMIDVSAKKTTTGQASKARKPNKEKKKTTANKTAPFDDATHEAALVSAMTKYDALEAYFDRGDQATIIGLLNKEVTDDLGAVGKEQIKCIGAAVGKKVGSALGRWKNVQTRTV